MKALVAFAHALADETRLRIVHLILNEALCVCEIADILGMPQSSVSSHVQVIRKAGLLNSERRGKWVYYRMASRHRKLVQTLNTFFAVSNTLDTVLRADAASAVARIALREQDCCPAPLELATRKPAGALSKC